MIINMSGVNYYSRGRDWSTLSYNWNEQHNKIVLVHHIKIQC